MQKNNVITGFTSLVLNTLIYTEASATHGWSGALQSALCK